MLFTSRYNGVYYLGNMKNIWLDAASSRYVIIIFLNYFKLYQIIKTQDLSKEQVSSKQEASFRSCQLFQ